MKDNENIGRLKQFHYKTIAVILLLLVFTIFLGVFKLVSFAAISIIILIGNLRFLSKYRNYLSAAHLFLTTVKFTVVVIIFLTGGVFSPAFPWMAFVPVTSVLLFGESRNCYSWLIITAAFLLLFSVLEAYGFSIPQPTDKPHPELVYLALQFGLIYVIVSQARIFNSQKSNALKIAQYKEIDLQVALEDAKHARIKAQEATELKSVFLTNMSHEIRTPMNAIIGFSHLALRTQLDTRQRDYLSKIQRSSDHLLGIINDILDLSKIEAGKLELEVSNFSLEEMLDKVASLVGEKAGAKSLELLFDIAPEVPVMLRGDALRLSQMLINYANNAVKFTETGEIVVVVRVINLESASVTLKFEVRDTGIGLSPLQISNLFQSFHQADISTTRKFGGTGLGLAITKILAQKMDGEVGVSSVEGQGSTFWFTARLAIGSSGKPLKRLEEGWSMRRVLVVDDIDTARQIMCEMLISMKFQVSSIGSGEEAIEAVARADAANQPFDVVLVDWLMPSMDGIETTKRLHDLELIRKPHIAMVTSYGRDDLSSALIKAGGTDVSAILTKPIGPSQLFNTINDILGEAPLKPGDTVADESINNSFEEMLTLQGARILLAEDNLLNQQLATELLQDFGLVVETADNGKIACEMVAQTVSVGMPYDLILMDMQMPLMDGLEAAQLILKNRLNPTIPIVAMTANVMSADRELCHKAGMVDFVSKPIDPEDLFRALLTWIPPRGVRQDISCAATANEPLVSELPQEIVGLNLDVGLRRVMGKPDRYFAMLHGFVADQTDAVNRITSALDSNDYKTAERLVHTLKNLSGNIAASALLRDVVSLEGALRKDDEWQAHMAKLEVSLRTQIAQIKLALAPLESKIRPKEAQELAPDSQMDARICEELALSLTNDDGQADKLFAKHTAVFYRAFPNQFESLKAAINKFDSELALEIIHAAQQ